MVPIILHDGEDGGQRHHEVPRVHRIAQHCPLPHCGRQEHDECSDLTLWSAITAGHQGVGELGVALGPEELGEASWHMQDWDGASSGWEER
jgi:hypothetical protein